MGCLKLSYEYEREGLEQSAVFLGEGLEKSATEQNFRTNYYPFGLHHSSSWTRVNDLKNNFLFNAGSELNAQTKNYETPFRQYDPALGRFTGIDALASSFSSWTPYQFAYNDPIAFNDPTGLQNQSGLMGDMYGELGHSPYGVRQADYGQGIRSRGPYAGYGVGSGYHWSDQYRSVEGNLDLMSTSTFRGFYGIDGMSDSELADFAIYNGLGSSNREDIESVTGWNFHDSYTHDGQGTSIPFVAVTSGGGWIGNLPIDIYQQSKW
ncbi:MAG: RHS repeat-associated core domain-containing protein [Bacteroidota bacterium]